MVELGVAGSAAFVLADGGQAGVVYERMSTVSNRCAVEGLASGGFDTSVSEFAFPGFGEDSSAFQIRAEGEALGEQWAILSPAIAEFVHVRSGRVVSVVLLVSYASSLKPTLREKLVTAVAGRMT